MVRNADVPLDEVLHLIDEGWDSAGTAIDESRQQAEKRRRSDPEAERLRQQFGATRAPRPQASIPQGGILAMMGGGSLPTGPNNLQRLLGVTK
jgi:hypothetical protein